MCVFYVIQLAWLLLLFTILSCCINGCRGYTQYTYAWTFIIHGSRINIYKTIYMQNIESDAIRQAYLEDMTTSALCAIFTIAYLCSCVTACMIWQNIQTNSTHTQFNHIVYLTISKMLHWKNCPASWWFSLYFFLTQMLQKLSQLRANFINICRMKRFFLKLAWVINKYARGV